MKTQTEVKHTLTPTIEGIHGRPEMRNVVYRVPKEKVDSVVRAVNSHEAFLKAAKKIQQWFEKESNEISVRVPMGDLNEAIALAEGESL